MTFEQEKRAYELYLHASELVEPELSAWLESRSIEAEVLDEVRGLLAVDSAEGSMPPNGITGALRLLRGTPASGEDLVGKTLGPYLIEELLRDTSGKHKGGMGFVYKARRNDGAGDRIVAIKVVQWPHTSDRERELFLRERRNLFKLTHTNIVQIIDAGTVPDGRPYYVMEWVEGGSDFTDHCEHRNLTVRERVELFLSVCSAVKRAHSSGVIHKDLKPSNIQVDRDGVPKLLDFGLSSLLAEETTENLARSILTPAYASPEQMRGEVLTLSSDVYSLGLVLRQTLGKHAIEDEASRVSLRTTSSLADMELRSIVSKMLAHDPSDRYQTVDAVERDLGDWLSGRVVGAYRSTTKSGPAYVAQKFVRRNLVGVSLSALAALVLIYGFISITSERNEALRQRTSAIAGQLAATAQVQIDSGDIATGALLAVESIRKQESFEANQAARKGLRYLPDRIWSIKPAQPPSRLSFSPDGKYIGAFYDELGKAEVRNSLSGELVLTASHGLIQDCKAPRTCGFVEIAFHPARAECATSGEDGVIRIWDLQLKKVVLELPATTPGLRKIAYWNTRDVLAASIDEDRVGLFDAATGRLLSSALTGGELPALSSDGKMYVLSQPITDNWLHVTVRDPRSDALVASVSAESKVGSLVKIRVNPKLPQAAALVDDVGGAPRLAFLDLSAPKGNTMVLGAPFDVSTPWNPAFELNLPPSFWGREAVERSRRLRFSADGRHLTVFDSKRVFLVDTVEKKILKVWPTGPADEGMVEGSTYLTPPGFQGTRSYSLPDLQLASVLQVPMTSAALSPSGRSFVIAQRSGKLELWAPHHLVGNTNDGPVVHAAFSSDSLYMASIHTSGSFVIRSVKSDEVVHRDVFEQASSLTAPGVSFSPSGKYVALHLNAKVYLYESGSWKPLSQSLALSGARGWINNRYAPPEFLDNDRWLQQKLLDKTVILSVPDLKTVYELEPHGFVAAMNAHFAVVYRARSKSSGVEVVSLPSWKVLRRFEIAQSVDNCSIGDEMFACSIGERSRDEQGQVKVVGGMKITYERPKPPTLQAWSLRGNGSDAVDLPAGIGVLKVELSDGRVVVYGRNGQSKNIDRIEYTTAPLHLVQRRTAPEMESSFPLRLSAEVARTSDLLGYAVRLLKPKATGSVEMELLEPVDQEETSLYVSDDERFAALTLADGFFRLEPLRGSDLVDSLCRKLTSNLSKSDWNRFFPDEPYRSTCSGLPQRQSQ